jgi:hypothetical protein
MSRHRKRATTTGVLTALVVAGVPVVSVVTAAGPSSAATAEVATLVATRDTGGTGPWSPTSPDPSGITYNPSTDRLEISDGEVDEMPIYAGANVYTSTRQGGLTGTSTTVPWSNEPTDLAINTTTGQRYYTDDDKKSMFVQAASGGTPTSFKTSTFGLTDPEGVAYDGVHNMVWMSDGVAGRVYGLAPGPNGTFNGVPPAGDDVVAVEFDINKYGSMEAEGIEYDAVRDTIIVLDDSNTVLELDRNGSLLTTIDISAADPVKNAGITIAPASDGSGDRHYYLADRGLDNNSHPTENDGLIYEMSVDLDPITNRPPSVNAGADQMIDQPETANLMGAITDDGQPNGSVTATWSVVPTPPGSTPAPGTGTVTFGNANAANTTATFSATGRYTLRLTADDGGLSGFDDVIVDVYEAGGIRMVQIPIAHGADDAIEISDRPTATPPSTFVDLSSADDEFGNDGPASVERVMTGLRFTNIPVPAGGVIESAKIQFKTDEIGTDATSFTIHGEAADNAAQFVGGRSFNISSRADTTNSVPWSPAAWSLIGEAGVNQQTPELKTILQEIIDRPGWAQGNAVAFTVDAPTCSPEPTCTGRRTAEAKDGLTPPVLLLQFRLGPGGGGGGAPTVNAGTDQTIQLPAPATLDGTVTDDGLPNPPGATTSTWSKVSGPGDVTFGNAAATDTNAVFSASGTYVLRLTANDGASETTDDVTVEVQPAAAVNTAPVVDAGPDQTVQMPGSASLDGTLTDDGLPNPPAATTATWTEASGPGTVTFASGSAVDTTATFSAAGTYVLRLTGNDSAMQANDTVSVTVQAAAIPVNLTMTANPTAVTVPNQTTLSGRLTRTTGQNIGNRPIQIWVQRNGGAATLLRTVNTQGNGTYSTTDRPDTQSTYWAVHVANGQYGAAESPHRTVNVQPRLTATLSRSTATRNQAVFVRGVVEPAAAGTPVRLQRRNGTSQWVLVQEKTLAAGNGSYEFDVRQSTRGTFRFRVTIPAYQGRQARTMPTGSNGLVLVVS